MGPGGGIDRDSPGGGVRQIRVDCSLGPLGREGLETVSDVKTDQVISLLFWTAMVLGTTALIVVLSKL